MIAPIEFILIFSLLGIILLLFLDRASLIEAHTKEKDRLLEELSRTVKAVISKNANEYVMTTSIDKVPTEEKPAASPDELPEEALSDEEFYEAVGKGLKK